MCLVNYCSYCMHIELFYFRNLAPENVTRVHSYKLRLAEDDTPTLSEDAVRVNVTCTLQF